MFLVDLAQRQVMIEKLAPHPQIIAEAEFIRLGIVLGEYLIGYFSGRRAPLPCQSGNTVAIGRVGKPKQWLLCLSMWDQAGCSCSHRRFYIRWSWFSLFHLFQFGTNLVHLSALRIFVAIIGPVSAWLRMYRSAGDHAGSRPALVNVISL